MALIVYSLSVPPSPLTLPKTAAATSSAITLTARSPRLRFTASSSSSSPSSPSPSSGGGYMDFPYATAPVRDLMMDLVSTVESRIGSQLLPCSLPPDVARYGNESGSAEAALLVRSGVESSPGKREDSKMKIDFILGSWIYCQLPSGAALNITSLSCYLNDSTDAPNFLVELIQNGPTSLVLILDLPPRKDLVLHPDYLKTFYEDTQLDKHRQQIEKIPEVNPYVSTSLYLRCTVSPTAIFVTIKSEAGGAERLEEIVRDKLSVVAKDLLGKWLVVCLSSPREVEEDERSILKRRDQVFKSKTIEIDLGSSLPRLFGQETANRVLEALKGLFST
ncbi:Red chlorophyll catabolite reductase, chloroplastic-like protein [Drosera capensis]